MSGNWQGLDVIKLKGTKEVYRCRVGRIRIIFYFANNIFELHSIDNRNESTYKNF